MTLQNIDDLRLELSPGEDGHIKDHEKIAGALITQIGS